MNNTLQRKEILKIMQTTPGHFSADELYTVLRKKIPQISLATVYRNLELLSSVGKLQKIKSIIPQKHFESNCTSHFHVHCPVCGKIEDIYYDSAREIEEYINTKEPYDKAGAYGVQEWIGYVGVTKMEGSYFNVMGFPISRVYDTLRELAIV